MVEWSIAAFRAAKSVRAIVVAAPPGHVHNLAGGDLGVVAGGKTRAESVSNAMAAVGTDLVAVHDAARPLVTPELIESLVAALKANADADGAIAAAPVTDTIKQTHCSRPAEGGPVQAVSSSPPEDLVVLRTLDRGRLWAAQTPQVFRVDALRRALAESPRGAAIATDEAMLIEEAGGRVLIHRSPPENLKVTTPLDLELAKLLLSGAA
jgi:2-C-methyl-D-erythritol 4-phosphate cytidylyltransferase